MDLRTPRVTGERRSVALTATLLLLAWLLAACGGVATTPNIATPGVAVGVASPSVTASPTALDAPPTSTPTGVSATVTRVPVAPPTPVGSSSSARVVPPPPPLPPTATLAPAPPPVPRAWQPLRLKIPRIGVDAVIESVGLTPDGAMDIPKDYADTAWYEPGPRPGDQGNAAIAGHVDSKTGPAVFWELSKLQAGDEVFVVGSDGSERRFALTGSESYKRDDAPLGRIFGPTTGRQLNLITCDRKSTFDRTKGGYAANVVVYTELVP